MDLKDSIIYHCGPVVVQEGDTLGREGGRARPPARARNPTRARSWTSYGIRGVIGKGGMGPRTLQACREVGGVYLHAIGGAAQVLAERVVAVDGVHFLEEFGSPEAIWDFRVDRFPGRGDHGFARAVVARAGPDGVEVGTGGPASGSRRKGLSHDQDPASPAALGLGGDDVGRSLGEIFAR